VPEAEAYGSSPDRSSPEYDVLSEPHRTGDKIRRLKEKFDSTFRGYEKNSGRTPNIQ